MCPCIVDIVGPGPLRPQSPPPGQRGKGLFEQMIPEIMTPLKTVYQQHISKINTEAKRFSGASHLGKVQEYSEIGQVGRRGGGGQDPPGFSQLLWTGLYLSTHYITQPEHPKYARRNLKCARVCGTLRKHRL